MAGQFFKDLDISSPDVSLDVGPGPHEFQTTEVMKLIEAVFERERPDVVIVVGDVNSTVAGAITASKMQIRAVHVEAGLRSFDRTMSEEINRVITDAVSDYLFVSEESGLHSLAVEGVEKNKVFFVGNVMIDSLEVSRHTWGRSSIHAQLGVTPGKYGVMTLHRSSNVDQPRILRKLLGAIAVVAEGRPVIFPVHPRPGNG